MPTDCLSYKEAKYFTGLILDYLDQKEELEPFYNRFPSIQNFKEQIEEKQAYFSSEKREALVEVLKEQYGNLKDTEETLKNIQLLLEDKTFTVTTGHQLNLFTGPLYFLYKIVTAINLASALKKEYPEYNFVPVYWMATEDHDFEEINFFNLHGKKFQWNSKQPGAGKDAVGNLNTEGLEEVFQLFSAETGGTKNAEELKDLFRRSYLENSNLTEATRVLAHDLFKEYGLVILDADDPRLKREFLPYLEQELFDNISHKTTAPVAEKLKETGYGVQVNPREINLFYLNEGLRERIIEREGTFYINETQKKFSRDELKKELEEYPERFSPNVMTRPLYQEVILPNLCYIGGGGELAYWFELKEFFKEVEVPFPILLLRNSVLIETAKQNKKRKNLDIAQAELFLKQHELINRKVRKISNIDIDFSPQKEHLIQQFLHLYELAEKTDPSFLGAVKAQEVKQLKGLENLERRLLKAQKKKLSDEVSRIADLQNELFPGKALQERQINFSEMYLQYGKSLIPELINHLNPLDLQFCILIMED